MWIAAISNHGTAFYLVSAASQTFRCGRACSCGKWHLSDSVRSFEAECSGICSANSQLVQACRVEEEMLHTSAPVHRTTSCSFHSHNCRSTADKLDWSQDRPLTQGFGDNSISGHGHPWKDQSCAYNAESQTTDCHAQKQKPHSREITLDCDGNTQITERMLLMAAHHTKVSPTCQLLYKLCSMLQ